jgi:hypothetical protein
MTTNTLKAFDIGEEIDTTPVGQNYLMLLVARGGGCRCIRWILSCHHIQNNQQFTELKTATKKAFQFVR